MSDSFFKAIADPSRRTILQLLHRHGTLSAGEIATHFEFSKAALSDHLKVLRMADLIVAAKKGQYIYYSLNTSVLQDIISWILQLTQKSEEKNDSHSEV